jgi:hypothetical protein
MLGFLSNLVDRFPLGRCWCLAVLVACLGTAGCSNLNLRGERFSDNELSNLAGELRQADTAGPSDAFSNKARQIDRNLGGSRPISSGESWLAP